MKAIRLASHAFCASILLLSLAGCGEDETCGGRRTIDPGNANIKREPVDPNDPKVIKFRAEMKAWRDSQIAQGIDPNPKIDVKASCAAVYGPPGPSKAFTISLTVILSVLTLAYLLNAKIKRTNGMNLWSWYTRKKN